MNTNKCCFNNNNNNNQFLLLYTGIFPDQFSLIRLLVNSVRCLDAEGFPSLSLLFSFSIKFLLLAEFLRLFLLFFMFFKKSGVATIANSFPINHSSHKTCEVRLHCLSGKSTSEQQQWRGQENITRTVLDEIQMVTRKRVKPMPFQKINVIDGRIGP